MNILKMMTNAVTDTIKVLAGIVLGGLLAMLTELVALLVNIRFDDSDSLFYAASFYFCHNLLYHWHVKATDEKR